MGITNGYRCSANSPVISVVMPVKNVLESHLTESMESLLAQNFSDYEVIILDNGVSEKNYRIILSYLNSDKRFRLIDTKGSNLAASLNTGIRIASTNIIARFDADDICEPTRLSKQLAYLLRESSAYVVGAFAKTIDQNGNETGKIYYPTSRDFLSSALLIRNPIVHPTVMYYKDYIVALGGYSEALDFAQDYDLWVRVSKERKLAVLGEYLLRYRISNNSVTALKRQYQLDCHRKIVKQQMFRIGCGQIDEDKISKLLTLFVSRDFYSRELSITEKLRSILCFIFISEKYIISLQTMRSKLFGIFWSARTLSIVLWKFF